MKKIIKTKNAPSPVGPYNQAILFNNTLYASGQIAINPLNNQIINEDIEAETKQVMENLNEVLIAIAVISSVEVSWKYTTGVIVIPLFTG